MEGPIKISLWNNHQKKLVPSLKILTEELWSSFLFVSIKRQRDHVALKRCRTKWVPDDSCCRFELVLESEKFQPSTRQDSRKRGTRDRSEAGRNTKRILGWNFCVGGRSCDNFRSIDVLRTRQADRQRQTEAKNTIADWSMSANGKGWWSLERIAKAFQLHISTSETNIVGSSNSFSSITRMFYSPFLRRNLVKLWRST